MTVSLPFPCELKASIVWGAKSRTIAAAGQEESGEDFSINRTEDRTAGVPPFPPWHIAERIRFFASTARPAGALRFSPKSNCLITLRVLASTTGIRCWFAKSK
jgi:hypothetical protein